MHAFHLKERQAVDLQPPGAPEGTPVQDKPASHVLQCTLLTSISNHPSAAAHTLPHTFTPQNPQVLGAAGWTLEWDSVWLCGWFVWLIVFACCVRPVGLSVCSLPGVEKGLAVASQPWPAGLSCPREAEEQGARACLHLQVVNLTSYCTDTSIIVIKGQSNLFIYWFPSGGRQD